MVCILGELSPARQELGTQAKGFEEKVHVLIKTHGGYSGSIPDEGIK